MDPIEKAIRTAFEKGKAEDKAFREKVYRSAFAALDRAIQANPGLTVETAINRRKNLQAKIASIETEYSLALAPDAPPVEAPRRESRPAPQPFVEPPVSVPPEAFAKAPSVRIEPVPGPAPRLDFALESPFESLVESPGARDAGPSFSVETPTVSEQIAVERRDSRIRAKERRRPFAAMFILVTLVTACALGGWWAHSIGLLKAPDGWDLSGSPGVTIESEEDYEPPAGEAPPLRPADAEAERNWIVVFSPTDPSTVSAPTGATAEAMQDESGAFLRVRSGSTGAAVVFDVGQGILDQIVGKKAVFDIVARAEEGKGTQISISCDFGELGDCGRRRYAVGYEKGEYLFDIDLPQKNPGADGSIAINSDFENKGKAVDIYEIRVSVSQ